MKSLSNHTRYKLLRSHERIQKYIFLESNRQDLLHTFHTNLEDFSFFSFLFALRNVKIFRSKFSSKNFHARTFSLEKRVILERDRLEG